MAQGCNIPHAVPFSKLKKSVPLPDKRSFPAEIRTIGDHLKHARLERNLLIKDVLKTLKVDRETYRGWEANRYEPFVRFYPRIIQFLGYYPFDHETKSLGGRIKKYRFINGFNQEQFSEKVCADRCTVRLWELNQRTPSEINLKKLTDLITNDMNKHADCKERCNS